MEISNTNRSDSCPLVNGDLSVDDQNQKTYGGIVISACHKIPGCSKSFEVVPIDVDEGLSTDYIVDEIQGTCPLETSEWN